MDEQIERWIHWKKWTDQQTDQLTDQQTKRKMDRQTDRPKFKASFYKAEEKKKKYYLEVPINVFLLC